jgi:uncharacterized membrane protein YjgN (DUF898 family)
MVDSAGNPDIPPGTDASIAAMPPASVHRYPVEFTATAGEYFRIWIVNLALTILTLGIYSAWAKVRKRRYFYSHTLIDGECFEYRANPVAILKGRIIAVVLFAAYSFGGRLSPILGGVFGVVLFFAVPWLMVRSFAFNAYNSAYRNIRPQFRATYLEALKLILVCALLVLGSLGLAYPYATSLLLRFIARNHSYGTTPFEMGALSGALYRIYFKAVGLVILGVTVFIILAATLGGVLSVAGLPKNLAGGAGAAMGAVLGYLGYLLLFAYLRARITNVIWNALTLGPVKFECTLRARDLTRLYAVNIIAIIVTLGLAAPWAVVRTLRYRAQKMTLTADGGLDGFVAAEATQVSAAGEEVGEMFDFDFGF